MGADLLIFHAVGSAITNYMVYWSFTCVQDKPYVDNAVQLTVLTLLLINLYYLVVLYQDIKSVLGFDTNQGPLPYGDKTYLYFQTIFSMAHLVAVAYWALRLYDIRLVVPEAELSTVDWRSSYTHGLNLIPLYLELGLFTQIMPKKRMWKMIHYSEITILYVALQYVYFTFTGKQVYPFLGALPLWIIGCFYGTLFLFMLTIDVWGCCLINTFHGRKVVDEISDKTDRLVKAVKNS